MSENLTEDNGTRQGKGRARRATVVLPGMFTIATVAAQIVMHRYYRLLIIRHRNHRIMFYAWLVMYAFVGMQMGWVLRPFLGSPGLPTTFFRQDPFTNAYVVIANLIFGGG